MSGGDGSGLGPTLNSDQAAKLLVLMCHARHCPGNHRSARLAEVQYAQGACIFVFSVSKVLRVHFIFVYRLWVS